MSVEIKSVHGKTLYVAKGAADVREAVEEAVKASANLGYANLGYANLGYANLGYANLGSANLGYANLGSANLGSANLGYANLGSANLGYANLGSANLGSANLGSAKNFDSRRANHLLLLLDQPGKVRAYKLVTAKGEGPYNGGITYEIGGTFSVENANCDPRVECAEGINLATLPWCMRGWAPGYRILVAEFTAKDIAAIPLGDGKFRVKRCKIVGEKDLVELGLVEHEAEQEPAA